MIQSSNATRLMRIQARPGSPVEARHYRYPQRSLAQLEADAIAPGIPPDASADLKFHGGKTVPQMVFQNVFLGGRASWLASDIDSINTTITLAMQDRRLNNVVAQFFDAGVKLTCDPRPLFVLEESHRAMLDQPSAKQLVSRLVQQGQLSDSDLGQHNLQPVATSWSRAQARPRRFAPRAWRVSQSRCTFSSRARRRSAYYSANVFSQRLPNGRVNGIPAFDASWKDVVGTLYHEINEFRTDPDVGDAIEQNSDDFLGWMGAQGEIGDQPIAAAGAVGNLSLVFQEIMSSTGNGRVPVQFLFSNAVHGAEGPIDQPDPPAKN